MIETSARLRIALLAGSLVQGGAEKQFVYMAQALQEVGADVRIYSLTRGEFYEAQLQSMNLAPIWVGSYANPALRVAMLAGKLWSFHPHVIQSSHSFANLYASLAGRMLGAISIGALRCSLRFSHAENGAWNRWLIGLPTALVPNSEVARQEVIASGLVDPTHVYLLPNVIDVSRFALPNTTSVADHTSAQASITAVLVARLVAFKRVDRFLRALARARGSMPGLRGIIVGDGPERGALERLAADLGLGSGELLFLGRRDDVPELLAQADMLVLTSDNDEGQPNVILEAMAARLPVITTPAGDAGTLVVDCVTGFVVPFEDTAALAAQMAHLAAAPELRRQFGASGRQRVEQSYALAHVAERLLWIYAHVAQQQHRADIHAVIQKS